MAIRKRSVDMNNTFGQCITKEEKNEIKNLKLGVTVMVEKIYT